MAASVCSPVKRILSCTVRPDQLLRAEKAAEKSGLTLARWVRQAVLAGLRRGAIVEPEDSDESLEACAAVQDAHAREMRKGWAGVFGILETYTAPEALGEFNRLAAGRVLPKGFAQRPRQGRIEWLDKNWPLEKKQ